jgi:peptide/nickel transport system permease protein
MAEALLQVSALDVKLPRFYGDTSVVSGFELTLRARECVGLVGESGCGKSLVGLTVMGLEPSEARVSGRILLDDRDVLKLPENERHRLRGSEIAMIYQDALTSLNPGFRVGTQLRQVCERKGVYTPAELLDMVRLGADRRFLDAYPHELSGGQRQRVLIAIALAQQPRILLADEPTTALDVTVQAQIVNLLQRLKEELGFALILVSHDLGLVSLMADRVTVMYAGQVAEEGPTEEVLRRPLHPYSAGLVAASASLSHGTARLAQIPGVVPSPHDFPSGCRFRDRCGRAQEECQQDPPIVERPGAAGRAYCVNPIVLRGAAR